MTDLSKLTAKDFSDAMHKGWRKLEWCDGDFFQTKTGKSQYRPNKYTVKACALGAMAYSLGADPCVVMCVVDDLVSRGDVADSSNNAGNKRAAMKAVDAILLKALPSTPDMERT